MTENFSANEFACKCGCGYNVIEPVLVNRLRVYSGTQVGAVS